MKQEHKGSFLLSRFLWATGLCRLFSITLPQGPRMRFFPTSLSAALWLDPDTGREEAEFILSHLRPGDTFVDVGANVGWLSLLAAQRVGPSGSVVAIEPHPRTFAFLRENVRFNGFTQVRLIHAAAGDRAGEARISNFRADDMNHLGEEGGAEIPLVTLDSLGIEQRVALVKTDTEGFEPFVLEGARSLLLRVDCIYFECSEWNLNRYGRNSRQLRALLESAGFRIYRRNGDGLAEVDGDYDAGGGGNLVALRKP